MTTRLAKKVATRSEIAPVCAWAVEERASRHIIGQALLTSAPIEGTGRFEINYALARDA